ncbi:hypothetical protein Raf01_28730 [Rugosimonospora africana]|uniref:Uncharacterized protein n=1 Tax=Rugosimonospora africana TaxID=556532 RepID=A0A8J3QQJ7_9ACTN|nr:hypothetical protein Raf01_28730 [Rugosimonospora africana]
MILPRLAGCPYCIDGYQPAGVDLYLGPVYMACQICIDNDAIDVCADCGCDSLFPAFTSAHRLAEHLARYGLAPVLCLGCFGITDFRAIEDHSGGTR